MSNKPELPAWPEEIAAAQDEAKRYGLATRTYVTIVWTINGDDGAVIFTHANTEFICRGNPC